MTAQAHRAQGTQNRPFRDESRHTHDNSIRSQKETVVFDNSFMLHPAAKRNRSHRGRCTAHARTGYNSLPLRLFHVGRAGTVKPANRGARKGPSLRHQARDESKGHPTPAPRKRATKTHSMEYQKRPAKAEARMKSAIRIRKMHFVCPEELYRAPNKF